MSLTTVSLDDDAGLCDDDGWESVEEARCERRTSRRRLRSAEACEVRPRGALRQRERERDDTGRRLFGDHGGRSLGGVLAIVVLLILAAMYFGGGWYGPAGDVIDRPSPVVAHGRISDHDLDYGYAYADYARRYDTGAAWSGWRGGGEAESNAEAGDGPWLNAPRAWTIGAIVLLLIIFALGASLGRSIFAGSSDD